MDDGDGAFTLELQAKQIAENAIRYNGSSLCPNCGLVMNPVEALYSKGMCVGCYTQVRNTRAKNGMVD